MDTRKSKEALKFESVVMDWFCSMWNISISHYTTEWEQRYKGENRQGIEMKNDQAMANTGNIYVSVERRWRDNDYVQPSGIYRSSNSWLYVIGNKDEFFIFSAKQLIQYYEANKPKLVKGFTQNKGTEYGFLLNKQMCKRLCIEHVIKGNKQFLKDAK